MISFRPLSYSHRRKPWGFSLNELAIVVGVTGILLGGVWLMAKNIMTSYADFRGWQDIQTIMYRIANAYQTNPSALNVNFGASATGCNHSYTVSSTPSLPGGSAASNAGKTGYYNQSSEASPIGNMMSLGIFPNDMIQSVNGVGTVVSPWGGGANSFWVSPLSSNGSCNSDGSTNSSASAQTPNNSLALTFKNLTVGDCNDVIAGNVAALINMGIQQICIGPNDGSCMSGYFFGSAPSSTTAGTYLNVADTNYWCSINNTVGDGTKVSVSLHFFWPPTF